MRHDYSPAKSQRRISSLVAAAIVPGEEHVRVAELTEVTHPHRIQYAIEVVALVLHDARMKTVDIAGKLLALGVKPAVAQAQQARHHAAQARNGQTTLPAILKLVGQRLEDRIDQHRTEPAVRPDSAR